MSEIFYGFLSTIRNFLKISEALKGVVCSLGFLDAQELKPLRYYHILKNVVLIPDISKLLFK